MQHKTIRSDAVNSHTQEFWLPAVAEPNGSITWQLSTRFTDNNVIIRPIWLKVLKCYYFI